MGFFLLWCGKKMINFSIILLLFLGTSCGGFMILFNLGAIPGLDEGKTTVMIIVACVCAVLGGILTFILNRILKGGENPE